MEKTEHNDILGRPITVGVPVVYPDGTSLRVGFIDKLNPKMVRIRRIKGKAWSNATLNRYPHDVCMVDEKTVTMYLLKQP